MRWKTILAILMTLFIVSCTTQQPVVDDSGATLEGVDSVVMANNKFAFDMYSELSEEEGNVFFSPYSIFSAMAMTYEGAKGDTAQEIKEVFYYPDDLRSNFARIYNGLNEGSDKYELRTANALWPQETYPFRQEYIDTVENYYGGKATELDYVNKAEESREIINNYIEEKTNDRIKDLIPAGTLNAMTRLVLTNAIYFKGDWVWQFDKEDTREREFKITPENVVQVPMMYMDPDKATFNYAELEKLQILELPYKGEKISMLILLPKQGETYDMETGERITYDYTLDDIELSQEKLNEYKLAMQETKMDGIYLPKFEFKEKYSLGPTLGGMGMPTAFSSKADFSGMDGTNDLFISEVIHQSFVKVDEEGTEAAAATAIVMEATAMRPMNVFRADHPFIFIIQDRDSGNILFMGRVVDPS